MISFIRRLIHRIRRKTRQASQENGKRQGSRVETIEFGREAMQGLVTTTISFIRRLIRRIRRKTRQASQENGKRQGSRVETIEFGREATQGLVTTTISLRRNYRVWEGSNARSCYYDDFFHSSFNSSHQTKDQTGKSGKRKAARTSRRHY